MQKSLLSSVFTLGVLSSTVMASAATYYASPSGTGNTCSAAAPCSLGSGINKIAGGDTLLLADGTYSGASVPSYGFNVTKSGTASAWTTIQAAPGAVPVIIGGGPSNNTGLGTTASYVQFIGIVVQKFNTGFANGWTGTGHVNDSNGNVRFINCIADGNGKNGIAFQSATGVLVRECLVAHNGGQADYASSGVDLFGAAGTYADNIVERNVSFENADTADHSDGSGFIVDDVGTGATFINNLGFRNGGSCIRLTQSTGTRIINNSCYADGLDVGAKNPTSPGEIFFSTAITQQGVLMINNVAIATGSAQDKQALFNAPTSGVSNNYTKNDGSIGFWADAAGTHPDFRLKATASELIDKGTATNGATNDIGFDSKCLTKAVPSVVGVQSWYAYSIDYDYIRALGGVAGCFKPAARTGTPDIGAYEYSSSVGGGGSGGTGGTGGVGGSAGAGGGGTSTGGTSAAGTSTGGVGGGGTSAGGTSAAGTSAGGVGGGGTSTGGTSAAGTSSSGGASAGDGGAVSGGATSGSGGVASGGVASSGAASSGAASGGAASGGFDSGGVAGTLASAGAGAATGGALGSAGAFTVGGVGGSPTTTGGSFGLAGSTTGSGLGGAAGAAGAGQPASGPATVPGIDPAGGEACSCRVAGDTRRAPVALALIGVAFASSLYRRRSRAPRR